MRLRDQVIMKNLAEIIAVFEEQNLQPLRLWIRLFHLDVDGENLLTFGSSGSLTPTHCSKPVSRTSALKPGIGNAGKQDICAKISSSIPRNIRWLPLHDQHPLRSDSAVA